MATTPPLFSAVAPSARQLLILLRCISFSKKAQVRISADGIRFATIEGSAGKTVKFTASLKGNEVFKGTAEINADGKAQVEFHINEPKLWYPHGYGEQTLYDVTATVTDGEIDLDSSTKRTGFRKGELIQ